MTTITKEIIKMKPTDQLITELIRILTNTKNFVLEQAPDLTKELVQKEIIMSSIYTISSLLVITSTIVITRVIFLRTKDDSFVDRDFKRVRASAIGLTIGVIALSALFRSSEALITCIYAPKVFILEYLNHLR
jgi:uncharacterized protein with NRDE domain